MIISRKHLFVASSAMFFALLLLVAPCKVRNSIEIALGIEKTEVSNKTKALTSAMCCASKAKVVCIAETQTEQQHRLVVNYPADQDHNTSHLKTSSESIHNVRAAVARQSRGITIPYYILHSNFKVYS